MVRTQCASVTRVGPSYRLSTGRDGGGIQAGINFENGGQLGKLQQLADEITGSTQRGKFRRAPKDTIADYHVSNCRGSPLATPFQLDLHIPRLRQRRVAGGFRETERRENSDTRRFHNTASETNAQFLVIRLWRGCACRGKQGKYGSGFLGGLRKPADVQESHL